jgi:dienelactone hydrolase
VGRGFTAIGLSLFALALAGPATAAAADPPLGLGDCADAEQVYQCSGTVATWDGIPLDATVTLPSAHARDRPLVTEIHGFGNSKWEYLDPNATAYTDNAFAWARDGYAVLTYTARGLWGSCGTPEARLAGGAACADGYIHLADVRYEARDTQELIGRLVDEGYADSGRIGVTGDSYGGGQSLMLAALRDRVMLPDGSLERWRSPEGTPLELGAAAPVIPWSDLISAAAPNGRVSATGITPQRRATRPVGVSKSSFINAIAAAAQFATGPGQPVGEPFVPGRPMGYLAPLGTAPEADVLGWVARTDAGEPYDDASAAEVVRQLTRYHSPYYLPARRPPAPLLLAAGFTDDLFPVDESLRFANRTARRHPEAPLSLLFGDFGHQRASNEPVERERLLDDIHGWFDHHLRGRSGGPADGATAYVQTCPHEADPLGPYSARRFADLAPGRLRRGFEGSATVVSGSGDPAVAADLDPVATGNSCIETDRSTAPGTARYSIGVPEGRQLTMIGAPRLRAELDVQGTAPQDSQLVGRLWDVAPGGETQRLAARGLYRPRNGGNRWQLHPGAWHFEPGHTIELELLGADAPYSRPSNAAFETTVSDLRITLPVRRP